MVDISVDDEDVYTDLEFRNATSFMTVPHGNLMIHDSSTGQDLLASPLVINFSSDKSYMYSIYTTTSGAISMKIKVVNAFNLTGHQALFFHGIPSISDTKIEFPFGLITNMNNNFIELSSSGSYSSFLTFNTTQLASEFDIYIKNASTGIEIQQLVGSDIGISSQLATGFLSKGSLETDELMLLFCTCRWLYCQLG